MRHLFVVLMVMAVPVLALAADWQVDYEASRLGFKATQTGTPFEGLFRDWRAAIRFDPAAPEQAVIRVNINMASVEAGDKQRNGALPGQDWFHVSAFPEARFVSSDVRALGNGRYEAHGTLTIRDVSRPVVLPFSLRLIDGLARARGELRLVRTDYGVGQGMWATGQWVGLDVTVMVDITARKAEE
ncbi:YceI family protein [Luteithermobacter gelatinilyticus]|uniref:YceI family protein n=1 Tax=Luteithermobacter gelatinilyticus TaxID=2582913 RepID=UPI0011068D24|nr:YceI family protein [Luteithermobacter gelatinilyticus]